MGAARHKGLMSFLGGSLAGTAATIGSYPFDLLRTVLASQGEPKVSILNFTASLLPMQGCIFVGSIIDGILKNIVFLAN